MLKSVDVAEFKSLNTRVAGGKFEKEVKEFMKKPDLVVEADLSGFCNIMSADTAYRNAIKRVGAAAYVTRRKNRLFIVKEGVEDC